MRDKTTAQPMNVSAVNRRTLLKGVGAGAAMGLAGCMSGGESQGTNDGGGDSGGEESTQTPAGELNRGGHLRLSAIASADTLNGWQLDSKHERLIIQSLNSYLTWMKPDLTVGPDLATDWEANEDATQWTFYLREDATWHHNGDRVVAEDIAATANAIYAEDSTAAGKGSLGPLESAEVVDDTTVRFNLSASDGLIPRRWARTVAPIYPADVIENRRDEMATTDFGSGPFELESFSAGDETVLTPYDDYYLTDEDGNQLPYLDKVTITQLPDTNTQVTSFRNEDVDILWNASRSQWDRIKSASGVNSKRIDASGFTVIQMRSDKPPFDDNRVRTAFKLAVNRSALLNGAASGLGTVAYDNPIGPAYPGHSDVPERTQDLDEAARLLEEAGYGESGDPIELDFYAPSSPSKVLDTTVIAAEHFNQLPNVTINVQQQSYDNWISNTWLNAQFYTSWYTQRPTTDTLLLQVWHSEGSWNEAHWSDEEFDQAADAARSAQTEEERNEHLATCQQILHERGPSVISFYIDALTAQQEYVNGFDPYPTQKWVRSQQVSLGDDAPTQ
ncbi:ABC transporter substrate-binding protein [Halobellus salinus]|nr:ABC transporter substrate-binding protein [Halobellus salinus]SMP34382.1 peptide/nickel transport system substrate-binding protein [Halobellus salinus]